MNLYYKSIDCIMYIHYKVLKSRNRPILYCLSLLFSLQCISQSWTLIGPPVVDIGPIHSVADESSLYLGSAANFSGQTYGSIFRLLKDSSSYDTLVTGIDVKYILPHPNDPQMIFAALSVSNYSEPGILKSIDGGDTWFHSDSGIYLDWETGVQYLSINPEFPDTMFASVGGFLGSSFYRSFDGGANWYELIPPGNYIVPFRITYNPLDPTVMFAADVEGVFKSSDYGDSWLQVFERNDGWGCFDIAITAADTNNLFTSCGPSGVFRSTDGGIEWQHIEMGIGPVLTGKLNIHPDRPQEIFVRASGGLYRSINNGDDWTDYSGNLAEVTLHLDHFSADGERVYIATDIGIFITQLPALTNAVLGGDPNDQALLHLYPNPFNSQLMIEVRESTNRIETILIYNIYGQLVKRLATKEQRRGEYAFIWDGMSEEQEILPSGVYIVSYIGYVGKVNSKVTLIR